MKLAPAFLAFSFVLAVTTLTGCASTGSHADASVRTTPDEAEKLFEILDVNGDGNISREEARSGFKYMIASYDRGGKSEILAAKPGASTETSVKKKSKRRPTQQDASRAFETLFENPGQAADGLSKEEFKKMVVKSSDNPETDPFAAFL